MWSRHIIGIAGLVALWAVAATLLTGCGGSDESASPRLPVAIDSGDECHVCGMLIKNYPGPKGEAYVRGNSRALKFCSTRDLFTFLLQPENENAVGAVYVHDMANTDWEHPSDSAFVDARAAWYVADQPLKGAMGPTLASFAHREDAERFAREHGGRLVRYQDITLELLADLSTGESTPASQHQ